MADASPKIAFYVSSVEGRLVSRPGSPHDYLGARTRTPDEIKAGITAPEWFTDRIVPVTQEAYSRHLREWDALLRHGDLKKRSGEDFAAFQTAQEKAEKAREDELAKAAKAEADAKAKAEAEAKKAAPKAAADQGGA